MRRVRRSRSFAAALSILLIVVLAVPVMAWQGEGGTRNCTDPFLGYVRFRYNDIADVVPPGSPNLYLYRDNDSAWHTRERNGSSGGGYWEAFGDPLLDLTQTNAGCRNYG